MKLFLALILAISCLSFNFDETINLTLRNNSDQSIRLNIPDVINPNLSPNSDSAVSFEEGQDVYFFIKKKKYLLFEASIEMKNSVIVVDQLIQQRMNELNLN